MIRKITLWGLMTSIVVINHTMSMELSTHIKKFPDYPIFFDLTPHIHIVNNNEELEKMMPFYNGLYCYPVPNKISMYNISIPLYTNAYIGTLKTNVSIARDKGIDQPFLDSYASRRKLFLEEKIKELEWAQRNRMQTRSMTGTINKSYAYRAHQHNSDRSRR